MLSFDYNLRWLKCMIIHKWKTTDILTSSNYLTLTQFSSGFKVIKPCESYKRFALISISNCNTVYVLFNFDPVYSGIIEMKVWKICCIIATDIHSYLCNSNVDKWLRTISICLHKIQTKCGYTVVTSKIILFLWSHNSISIVIHFLLTIWILHI